MKQISSDPKHTVIGIVRNKAATDKRVKAELSRSNIHIVQGDLNDYKSIEVCYASVCCVPR
jgi:hypothetical protein